MAEVGESMYPDSSEPTVAASTTQDKVAADPTAPHPIEPIASASTAEDNSVAESAAPHPYEQLPEDHETSAQRASIASDLTSLSLEQRCELALRGPTLIFDGICNLCNSSMMWFHSHLQEAALNKVYFMWAQHPDTQQLLGKLGVTPSDILRSWAYIEDDVVYRGSTAWFQAVRWLDQPWQSLCVFNLVPEILREGAYSVVAANRYETLGKSEVCQMPDPDMLGQFLHVVSTERAPLLPAVAEAKLAERRLLVIGCGPAGLAVVRNLAKEYKVIVVDPKDYYEYTPGILRGYFNPSHLPNLQVPLSEVFSSLNNVTHIRGSVVRLHESRAEVRLVTGGDEAASSDAGSADKLVDIHFECAVIATGSQYAGGGLWKVTGAPSEESWTSLEARNLGLQASLQSLQELEKVGGTCIMVGAGLVGVELAAEAAHFQPGLKVVLADLAEEVLPVLPPQAREYARKWLEKHGVKLRLGIPLEAGAEAAALGIEGPCIVLRCAGVKMRNEFVAPLNCLDERGQIRVNHAMQVIVNEPSSNDISRMGVERARICGSGRIFALGDCTTIDGVTPPMSREIYPAEAEAEVVVANLRMARSVQCIRSCPGVLKEMHLPLNAMTICSLGPKDAVFVMNGAVRITGWAAVVMKNQIESTKMGQYRSELWGSLVWSLVPHW